MDESTRKPELIVIAGPNGSGKTTITQQFLHHEWSEGITYINPDQVAKDMFGDWNSQEAVLNSARYDGVLEKLYVDEVPEWAKNILPEPKSMR